MVNALRKRLRSDEKGFTLIELLVVMIILAILMAIAIPSYLSFRDRANKSAAGSDLRAAIPSVEAFFSDHGTYVGMDAAYLKASYDQSLSTGIISVHTVGATTYCVQATSPNDTDKTAAKNGPDASIVTGSISAGPATAQCP